MSADVALANLRLHDPAAKSRVPVAAPAVGVAPGLLMSKAVMLPPGRANEELYKRVVVQRRLSQDGVARLMWERLW